MFDISSKSGHWRLELQEVLNSTSLDAQQTRTEEPRHTFCGCPVAAMVPDPDADSDEPQEASDTVDSGTQTKAKQYGNAPLEGLLSKIEQLSWISYLRRKQRNKQNPRRD
jgi:hypothetical protein